MKIVITNISDYIRETRHVENGHEFNVIKSWKSYIRRNKENIDTTCYLIMTHGNNQIVIYDYECEEIPTKLGQFLKKMMQ